MITTVTVGLGSCGIAAGANKTFEKIKALQQQENLPFILQKTSCIGMCYREPLVEITDETGTYLYGDINEDRAVEVIEKHINQNDPIRDANVKPPENCVSLVTTIETGNNIIISIAIFDHNFAVALGIASIHPSLYALIPAAKSKTY